jgi:phosphoenolpyruvate synthase/pyruvate phosphate dikinase
MRFLTFRSGLNVRHAFYLDDVEVTADATELSVLEGITATVAELNILDTVTATAAEINQAADADKLAADGLIRVGVARATFDPTGTSGLRSAEAHGLGVTLPANAVVIGGFYEVNTAFTSAGGNAGTVALMISSANDLVTATAVSNAIYGATGLKAIVPKSNTPEGTGIKCATAKEITATVAGQALTAGKLTIFLHYVVSAATA